MPLILQTLLSLPPLSPFLTALQHTMPSPSPVTLTILFSLTLITLSILYLHPPSLLTPSPPSSPSSTPTSPSSSSPSSTTSTRTTPSPQVLREFHAAIPATEPDIPIDDELLAMDTSSDTNDDGEGLPYYQSAGVRTSMKPTIKLLPYSRMSRYRDERGRFVSGGRVWGEGGAGLDRSYWLGRK